jgi:hypothetical protein
VGAGIAVGARGVIIFSRSIAGELGAQDVTRTIIVNVVKKHIAVFFKVGLLFRFTIIRGFS